MSPEPHYADGAVTVYHGDCRDVLADLPDASVDAVVTDPPYELAFMGRKWDATGIAYDVDLWRDVLRVLKPGGHLLAFGGTRTWHRLAVAVENAGFEIRDSIAWMYGNGFPKSLDVSKAIDKAGRADAERWHGWGTTLKPAFEPIVLARKPLAGTVAANVLAHGTGALNIDDSRVRMSETDRETFERTSAPWVTMSERRGQKLADGRTRKATSIYGDCGIEVNGPHDRGRWPPNVLLDEAAAAELDRQSGTTSSVGKPRPRSGSRGATQGATQGGTPGGYNLGAGAMSDYGDAGGASRFFPAFRYEPKAPRHERPDNSDRYNGKFPSDKADGKAATVHPTVKPLDLMRWLVRLVTPPGGTVLEPFAGSGTTAEACVIEGFKCLAIEREAEYLPLIVARLTKPIAPTLDVFGGEPVNVCPICGERDLSPGRTVCALCEPHVGSDAAPASAPSPAEPMPGQTDILDALSGGDDS